MASLQIDIIEPKARKLLEDLADLKLISIQENKQDRLELLLSKLRQHSGEITLQEITEEVEIVRAERYAGKKN